MAEVIILQRMVPHYRRALFERLYHDFGWQVTCAHEAPPGTGDFDIVRDAAFQRHFSFHFPDPSNPMRVQVPIQRILAETGARAVIAEFGLRMSSSHTLALRRTFGIAPITLFWSHGWDMGRGFDGWRNHAMQRLRTFLAARVDGHICYSDEGKAYLDRFLNPESVFVAHNSLGSGPTPLPRQKTAAWPSLISIGRLTPEKDVVRLVRLFARLRERFPQAVLTVIGDGPEMAAARAAAAGLPAGALELAGNVYDDDRLAAYFAQADLALFTGATGLAINHSLSQGVPVVLFERTAAGPHHSPEHANVINGTTGLRIHPYRDDAFIDQLCELLTRHPAPRDSFADGIRKHVGSNMSMDRMVEGFAAARSFLRGKGIDA